VTRLMARGFLQVFPVAAQTALIARGHLWLVFGVGYCISYIWRKNARSAAHEHGGLTDHAYAFGAAVASVSGPALVSWWLR
jgi:hypothetical protein